MWEGTVVEVEPVYYLVADELVFTVHEKLLP